jgi:ABC-type bacteriocin/lantibiotic exporter with double-glycine peptidase domain
MLRYMWRLRNFIEKKLQYKFYYLGILIILSSLFEVASLGVTPPFIKAIISPEALLEIPEIQYINNIFFPDTSISNIQLIATIIFILLAITSGLVRMFTYWFSNNLTFSIGEELSVEVFRRTLYQNYLTQVTRNSSEILSAISKIDEVIFYILLPTLNLISASVIAIAILGALFFLLPINALYASLLLGLMYVGIAKISRNRVFINSQEISHQRTSQVKIIQESLGGIRDIAIDNTQEEYINIYKNGENLLRFSQCQNQVLASTPRYIMETLGMMLIAFLTIYLIYTNENISNLLPILAVFAFSMQKLMPVFQLIYSATSTIRGSQRSLLDILKLLEQPIPEGTRNVVHDLKFENNIVFDNVSFKYSAQRDLVFKNLKLEIKKGSRVGIIGASGGGKSTFLDLLMGLLQPSDGLISVDGLIIDQGKIKAWQKKISHVPQSIFITDSTIASNIAFGVAPSKINYDLIREVSARAQILETINELPLKFNTIVGERGAQLSGGQRQRLGIARALYKQAEVLILDEATSALDPRTEAQLMTEIESMDKTITIIMIAHRHSTLKMCDQIIDINNFSTR